VQICRCVRSDQHVQSTARNIPKLRSCRNFGFHDDEHIFTEDKQYQHRTMLVLLKRREGKINGNCRPSAILFYALPILNIFVLQDGHTPWVAGLSFFILIAFGSFISFLDLHLTQYAYTINDLFFGVYL
jgi:hypothetical protein